MPRSPKAFGWAPMLDSYRNMIHHPGNARRLPRGAFSLLTFRPGPHGAFENDLPTIGFNGDPARIDLGTAAKCFLDLVLDVGRFDTGLNLDRVDNAFDAFDTANRAFRLLALIIPFQHGPQG